MKGAKYIFPMLPAIAMHAAADAATPGLPASKPNVVIVLLDDIGFTDFSCFGGVVPTPNIDRLASNGVRMSQMYNCARSCPTRASLLTGLYPQQAGVGLMTDDLSKRSSAAYQGYLNGNCVTLAEVMEGAGYLTAMAGKWHVCPNGMKDILPHSRGFRESICNIGGPSFFPNDKVRLCINGQNVTAADPRLPREWYSTDLWTDWGIKYIDMAVREDKPLLLYMAYTAAHFPLQAPEGEIARFKGSFSRGWDVIRREIYERQTEWNVLGQPCELTPPSPLIPRWDDLSAAQKARSERAMEIYAAMIKKVDDNVGRLIDELKRRGIFDNTVIMVLSDNGANAEGESVFGTYEGENPGDVNSNVYLGQAWAQACNTPFFLYKRHTHEGGISTGFIVSYPAGIPASLNGSIVHRPGHVIDIMPTLVELGGAKYPSARKGYAVTPMQGMDLMPVWLGGTPARKQPLFWEHEENVALRDGRWKLVKEVKDYHYQLYDMETDRTEMHDLSEREPEVMAEMMSKFRQMYKKAGSMPFNFNRNIRWAIPIEEYQKNPVR